MVNVRQIQWEPADVYPPLTETPAVAVLRLYTVQGDDDLGAL